MTKSDTNKTEKQQRISNYDESADNYDDDDDDDFKEVKSHLEPKYQRGQCCPLFSVNMVTMNAETSASRLKPTTAVSGINDSNGSNSLNVDDTQIDKGKIEMTVSATTKTSTSAGLNVTTDKKSTATCAEDSPNYLVYKKQNFGTNKMKNGNFKLHSNMKQNAELI
ncbi:hypothetical protein PV327_010905 [Microctonus hyperodae]|uniref:Uncharacterized protein n=1 Tax=Microctonus hyperodae TaxID=165561 RepID=A0AA39C8J9_MICHY|nr:hypothetical protein PV327_010905 [Microctonus hyperodae]